MSSVRLEILPWLNRYFSSERSRRAVLEMKVNADTTVRDVLEDVSAQNPDFKEVLFNAQTGRVAGHIAVILNGTMLELKGGLDAKLGPGDTIQVMPGFSGG
jgi:molybdopterin converting factor small subunit